MSQTCAISIDSRYLTQKGQWASGLMVKGKFYRKIAGLANNLARSRKLGCFGRFGRDALPQPQERSLNRHVQHERSREAEGKINNQRHPAARVHQPGQMMVNKMYDLLVREISAVSQCGDQAKSPDFG